MTPSEKKQIEKLRLQKVGYGEIAEKLNLSKNTVASYCKRHQMSKDEIDHPSKAVSLTYCKNCGKKLKPKEKARARKFCSDKCRLAWWNRHQECVNKKAYYQLICAFCGKEFEIYGNKERKYCSHECYIKDRFGNQQKALPQSDEIPVPSGTQLSNLPSYCKGTACPWYPHKPGCEED